MAVNAQAIKELRERTQAGMSDCKAALEEAAGDMEKAVEVILKKGLAKSAKKQGNVAAEGEVKASVSSDKRAATIVEVNIQTDFSARHDSFKSFVGDCLSVAENAKLGAVDEAQFHAVRYALDFGTWAEARELAGRIDFGEVRNVAGRRFHDFSVDERLVYAATRDLVLTSPQAVVELIPPS